MGLNNLEEENNLITICTVNYNTADFILNTLYCLEKITKNKYKVIIRDNNSKLKDYLKLEKGIKKFSNVELYRVEKLNYTKENRSMTHGIALNDLVPRINTKYGVILDADCTFLYRNWDEILINEINEEFPIIGTQAVPGYAGSRDTEFPLIFAMFFLTDILKKFQIDFRAINPKEGLDTGYQLKEKYLESGYKGKVLIGKNTRIYKDGPFNKVICEEYYLDGLKEIVACHYGRGATLGKSKFSKKKKPFGKDKKILIYFIPILGRKLLHIKAKRMKKKWINICHRIVNAI